MRSRPHGSRRTGGQFGWIRAIGVGARDRAKRLDSVSLVSLVVGLGYTSALVVLVARHGYFYGDDFSGFLRSRTDQFFDYVVYPVGGQVVPLARVVDWAFFRIAGLSYGAAVGTLCVLHLVGIAYLHRTLDRLGRSSANAVLVALYACYVYTWIQLGWWIAGLERMPFMALSAAALFHSVRHEQTAARRDLTIASVLSLLALGFYSKALLLPLCMIGLDVARIPFRELRARRRFFALRFRTAAAVFALSAVCSLLEHHAVGKLPLGNIGLRDLFFFLRLGLVDYGNAFFAIASSPTSYSPHALVGLLWLALVGYTCLRAPRAWIAWAVLFVFVLANLMMIGISSRVTVFGPFMALESRYYWELWYFTCLLLGVVVHELPDTSPEAQWLRSAPRAATTALAGALLAAYAILAYREVSTIALSDSDPMPRTRRFVMTLSAELKRMNTPEAPLKLTDDMLPPYVVGLDFTFLRQAQLLFLMGERVAYCVPSKAEYRITQDGHIVRMRTKKARPH